MTVVIPAQEFVCELCGLRYTLPAEADDATLRMADLGAGVHARSHGLNWPRETPFRKGWDT